MGLFSRRSAEPVVHPPVARFVFVTAPSAAVIDHLAAYGALFSPKRANEHDLGVAALGSQTVIALPEAVHPWQLHNLAFWMLDCPGATDVIARSEASSTHVGYTLVRDPEIPDALCGWADDGEGWTVGVPSNDVVRGEAVPVTAQLPVPARPPSGPAWLRVLVRLDDPGADMNPDNRANVRSRARLRDVGPSFGMI
jgi:hypothetical protein